jgi:hypothetical protein
VFFPSGRPCSGVASGPHGGLVQPESAVSRIGFSCLILRWSRRAEWSTRADCCGARFISILGARRLIMHTREAKEPRSNLLRRGVFCGQ